MRTHYIKIKVPFICNAIFCLLILNLVVLMVMAMNSPKPTESTYPIFEFVPPVLSEQSGISSYFDVPLGVELQDTLLSACERYEVEPQLALAVIDVESSYKAEAVSKSGDYGLMQINTINHPLLENTLGVTDFLEPNQNIEAGVYMLGRLVAKYPTTHLALMAYNLGESGANRLLKRGYSSTEYSRLVLSRMSLIKEKE